MVGRGRLGRAIAAALTDAGAEVEGPLRRGEVPDSAFVLLCVPEPEIAAAAAAVPPGPLVGHCSASAPLDLLAPHERFVLHPLMTVTAKGAQFEGATCAVDGSSDRALKVAQQLGQMLGMTPVRVAEGQRALYHTAAVMASNFLVALEGAAERVAVAAGVDRNALAPLARAAMENWVALGAGAALTGPITRGDDETVMRLRSALSLGAPDLVSLWDALAGATRALAQPAATTAPAREMQVVRTVAALRHLLEPARARGQRIGLVPTMGALHEGHLSLMRRARAECELVVATIFVNPTQFNDPRDLVTYPRDEAGDEHLARTAGVDLLFLPPEREVYPPGFGTTVEVQGLSDILEGAVRGPGHFRGVATIVAKLLNMTHPHIVYVGQKDAQQSMLIRRLARDLDIDARIEVCPTVREADGLAMSSRNIRLAAEDRSRAVGVSEALRAVETAVVAGERSSAALTEIAMKALAAREIGPDDVDYVAVVDPDTLKPVETVNGNTLVLVAAHLGRVRLLDNTLVHP